MANIIFRIIRRSIPSIIKNRITRILILTIGVILYGTFGFHFIEGQPWLNSLYWTFITIATVGYGDIWPETTAGLIFTITLIIVGVGTFALAIDAIVDLVVKRHRMRFWGLIDVVKSSHIVICGWTESTMECIKEIENKKDVFILDENESMGKNAVKHGINFVYGDPTRITDLKKANVHKAKAVIVDLQSDSKTIHCILGVRELNKDVKIIAQIERYENIEQVKLAGANEIISPFVISGRLMYKSIHDSYEAMFVQDVLAEHQKQEMKEIKIKSKSKFVGKTLEETGIHEKSEVIVVGVGRKGKLTIDPPRDCVIEADDRILVIGKKDELEYLENS
ncbi:MAG: potassium channel protein [Methanobacterium sp.]|nr:MAG: potassium channel protein [Methanobacterium sp.]